MSGDTPWPPDDADCDPDSYAAAWRYIEPGATAPAPKHNGHNGHDQAKPATFEFPALCAADFCAQVRPPEYLIDGLIQRGMLYGLTALTQHGKTAISMLAALSVSAHLHLGPCATERGRVIYLAGENPDDVRYRLIALCQSAGIAPPADLIIIPRAAPLNDALPDLCAAIAPFGEISLIIVDTNAAYFGYADENDNVDNRLQAQDYRALIDKIPGRPAVLVLCHPTKNATLENMIPRGGSAFMNEIDGNLTAWKNDDVVTLHHNKIRGPHFDALQFRLAPTKIDGLLDKKGREVFSVVAEYITGDDADALLTTGNEHAYRVLDAIKSSPNGSMAMWANIAGLSKSQVQKQIDKLLAEKFVRKKMGKTILTEAGKSECKNI